MDYKFIALDIPLSCRRTLASTALGATNKLEYHKKCYKHSAMKKEE